MLKTILQHARRRPGFRFCLCAALLASLTARAADSLVWRVEENKVDAQIQAWDLPRLLETITATTGWQIYVEPETTRTVSVKFKSLPAGDALSLLLGNLNFALLPQSNAPSKLFVFRTSVQEATQLVRPPPKTKRPSLTGKPIANELILTLKPGSRESIEELARRLGAKITGRVDALQAYRLQFEDEAAAKAARAALQGNDQLAAVDENFYVERPTQVEPLALSSPLPFSLKPTVNADGSRLVIGLIDTAVQPTESGMDSFLLPAISVAGDSSTPKNSLTHGTSMLETLLRGLALSEDNTTTPVRILPVDVYGDRVNTTTFSVAQGIYVAIQGGATLINLSLGSSGNSGFLQTMIQNAHQQGVVFFAAAGNESTAAPTYPAAYPDVVAVTAGDKRGNLASYANHGSFVDVVGPGTSIVYFNNRAYLVNGTSASTAYVAGMAAGLAASTGRPVAQVEAQIRRTFAYKPPAR